MFLNLISAILFMGGSVERRSLSRTSLLDANTYEVCLSPGCIADGAEATLLKLQALSPSGIIVKEGGCCSLCGNGPVVLDEANNKKYRKVSEKKLLDILFGEEDLNPQQEAVLKAFNLVADANDATDRNDYEGAVKLYEEAIDVGMQPALQLQGKRSGVTEEELKSSPPSGLRWLIKARKNEATAKLNVGDSDGAIIAAQSACELSQNASPDCLMLLHECYSSKGDVDGELKALRALFDLPEPEKISTTQANQRRTQGFRMAKLSRENSS
jgi:tetratricopeptide (TPR) repeat protein